MKTHNKAIINLTIVLIGLPTLIIMLVVCPFGFLYEAIVTGFIFGQSMFEELNKNIKSKGQQSEQ